MIAWLNDEHIGAWPFPVGQNVIRRGLEAHTFGDDVRRDAQGRPKSHQGHDYKAPIGTPFYAIGDGVIEAVQVRGAFGLCILLRHDRPLNGVPIWSFYAHLSKADVKIGATVHAGDVIGLTGESGNAVGMAVEDQHLHLEIRTEPWPGLGCGGRVSPTKYFGRCPLTVPA